MTSDASERPLPKPWDTSAALSEALALLPPGVETVLIGGLALAFHGIERYTKDVDLALSQADAESLAALWPGKEPKSLRIGGVSLLMENGVRVDFIDRRQEFSALFTALLRDAKQAKLVATSEGKKVLVAPLPYMVALKLVADRPQDEADLARLLALETLDYHAARAIVREQLGAYAAQRLDKLARQAGRGDAPKDYSMEPS